MFFTSVLKYEVEVYTGSLPFSGTNANVYMMLVGARGDTGHRRLLLPLASDSEKFQTGQVLISQI